MVIESYDYAGNYLILLFHDACDVMTKTTDNNALDETEEVFEYLLCAICPVQLSKPGLGYREDENRLIPGIYRPQHRYSFPDVLYQGYQGTACGIYGVGIRLWRKTHRNGAEDDLPFYCQAGIW